MIQYYDHMILAVNSIEQATRDLSDLGFVVQDRPNAVDGEIDARFVCFDDDSYLEISAFREPETPSAHRWWPILKAQGEGWIDYGMEVQPVEGPALRLTAAGLPVSASVTTSRSLRDGRRWAVQAVQAGRSAGGNPALPFFMEDISPRAIRVPPRPEAHALPVGDGVVGATLAVAELASVKPALDAVLGPASAASARLAGAQDGLLYRFNGRWLEVQAVGASTKSELAEHLTRCGDSIFEVTLGVIGSTEPGEGELLPSNLTHGGRIRHPAA